MQLVFQSMSVDFELDKYYFQYHNFSASITIPEFLAALDKAGADAMKRPSMDMTYDAAFIRVFVGDVMVVLLPAQRLELT